MKTKPGFPDFSPLTTPKVISESCIGIFIRQVAIHADRLSQVVHNQSYVSNFIERLRQIRRINERCVEFRHDEVNQQKEGTKEGKDTTKESKDMKDSNTRDIKETKEHKEHKEHKDFGPSLATLENVVNFTQYI